MIIVYFLKQKGNKNPYTQQSGNLIGSTTPAGGKVGSQTELKFIVGRGFENGGRKDRDQWKKANPQKLDQLQLGDGFTIKKPYCQAYIDRTQEIENEGLSVHFSGQIKKYGRYQKQYQNQTQVVFEPVFDHPQNQHEAKQVFAQFIGDKR